jgi:hypothetical protein
MVRARDVLGAHVDGHRVQNRGNTSCDVGIPVAHSVERDDTAILYRHSLGSLDEVIQGLASARCRSVDILQTRLTGRN